MRWVYRVWLVALGLLLCAATPDLWAAFGNRSPVLTGLLIAVLCVFALGAGVLAGLFSVNADKAVETAASRIHGVGSVLGFLALAFAPLLVALLAFRDGAGGAGVFSLICFALDVCCFTLFVMADKEAWRGTRLAQEGTWQRLTLCLCTCRWPFWLPHSSFRNRPRGASHLGRPLVLQNDADQSAGALVDDALECLLELGAASSGMRLSLPFKSSLTSSWKDLPKILDCQMALVSPSNS